METDARLRKLRSEECIENINFFGLCLAGETLAGKCFVSCSFTGADLSTCDATAGSFTNCNFSGCVLHDVILDGCIFTDCCFENANLSQASFIRASLTRVSLSYASLDRAVFAECVLSDVDWRGASFARVLLRGLEYLPNFVDSDLSMALFVNCDLSGLHLLRVKSLLFSMQECTCTSLRVEDCELTQLIMLNTDCSASVFERCLLQRVGFTGTCLDACKFFHCDMEGAFLNSCSLRSSMWRYVNAKTGNFVASDLSEATLEHVDMSMADLSYALFSNTFLSGVDMTLADAHGVDIGAAVLQDVVLEQLRHTDADRLAAETYSVR